MKILCTKIVNPITGEIQKHDHVLTIGKEYTVLEVTTHSGRDINYRLIGDDGCLVALHDSNQFKVSSAYIPKNWVIYQAELHKSRNPSTLLIMGPKAWGNPNFWSDYFDSDPNTIEIFEKEKAIIYSEENLASMNY